MIDLRLGEGGLLSHVCNDLIWRLRSFIKMKFNEFFFAAARFGNVKCTDEKHISAAAIIITPSEFLTHPVQSIDPLIYMSTL